MVHSGRGRPLVEALESRWMLSTVNGSVVDVINGRAYPIPDASVYVAPAFPSGPPVIHATADASGSFSVWVSFTGLMAGGATFQEIPPPGFQYSAGETGLRTFSNTDALPASIVFYNEAVPPAPPDLTIFGAVTSLPSTTVAGYSGGMAGIAVKNVGATPAIGATDIDLYASAPGSTQPSPGDPIVATRSVSVHLLGGMGRLYKFKYTLPASLTPGTYTLTAAVNTAGTIAESNASNNGGALAGTYAVAAPIVDIGLAFAGTIPTIFPPVKSAVVPVLVTNAGNVLTSGTGAITLYASTSQTLDASAVPLKTLPVHLTNLRPGAQKLLRLAFHGRGKLNTLAAGNYFLIATLTSAMDANAANNTVIGETATAFA